MLCLLVMNLPCFVIFLCICRFDGFCTKHFFNHLNVIRTFFTLHPFCLRFDSSIMKNPHLYLLFQIDTSLYGYGSSILVNQTASPFMENIRRTAEPPHCFPTVSPCFLKVNG